jgi:hypothetical protein
MRVEGRSATNDLADARYSRLFEFVPSLIQLAVLRQRAGQGLIWNDSSVSGERQLGHGRALNSSTYQRLTCLLP